MAESRYSNLSRIEAISSALAPNRVWLSSVLSTSIEDMMNYDSPLGKAGSEVRNRLMKMNAEIFLNSNVGDNAAYAGDSDSISGDVNLDGAADRASQMNMNYIDYVRRTKANEVFGSNTTREQITKGGILYTEPNNLYPDDLGSGEFSNKWRIDEKLDSKSILAATKKMFRQHKINTLISRFGTRADGGSNGIFYEGSVGTADFGESHGRNLLTKDAEDGKGGYTINGYNNPYCRVWTHHHQYDKYSKTMRPFSRNGGSVSLGSFHKWNGFESDDSEGKEYLGWKNGNNGWELSSLGKNGMPIITPKYKGGGSNNIHTKQCMFSIENLAWRGYDPYSFEKALSWEQRGPLGGRIMWFPPYDLSFDENVSTEWTSNTFIGRGENIYTYTNTQRSGTLSFLMVVDHPSVLDYASWNENKWKGIKDTDIMRFFAGCDRQTLMSAVSPTPLTDEYVNDGGNEGEDTVEAAFDKDVSDEIPDNVKTVEFYVFYPNNYSGYYDAKGSNTEAIPYLLNGMNASKCNNGMNNIAITFENLKNTLIKVDGSMDTVNKGRGYEMSSTPISDTSDDGNYIHGAAISGWESNPNIKEYPFAKDESAEKKWWYRIDGEYKVPSTGDRIKNTYAQTLRDTNRQIPKNPSENINYRDTKSTGLNNDIAAVKSAGFTVVDKQTYTLAEVALAICQVNNNTDNISILNQYSVDTERADELKEIFDNYALTEIKTVGYSTEHGANADNSINKQRNEFLAKQRGETVKKWLQDCGIKKWNGVKSSDTTVDSQNVEGSVDESDTNAKKWRSAKVTMSFSKVEVKPLAQSNEEYKSETDKIQRYVGFSTVEGKKGYYKDEKGNVWVQVAVGEDKGTLKRVVEDGSDVRERGHMQENRYDRYIGNTNKYRYDQEYHFFKELESNHKFLFDKLTDRLKYFDPAFHSMTPEGFNGRLTFLQQCMRQGNTVTMSDINSDKNNSDPNGHTANNLAFGRPPFCVLRIGDFYNQMIVIHNMSIDYSVSNGIQWDMNTEGIGLQPMLAKVTLNFYFIGGGDLGGPIRRLQNAMSFNYYANARLYDNRADRVVYNWDNRTNGAIDYSIDKEASYAYSTEMYKNKQ